MRHAADLLLALTPSRARAPAMTDAVPICTPKTLKIWNIRALPFG